MSSQAIQVYSKIQNPFEAAIAIGSHFARSGMFGVDRAEAGTILALACITENQTPFEILRTYDIVLGKLRKKALACYAEFRAKGGRCRWLNTGDEGKEAVGEFTFEGNTITVRFSIEDANKQGLVKKDSAWVKTPGNMLRARVLSNAIGMLCPEIVAGMVDGDDETAPTEPRPVLTEKPAVVTKAEVKVIDTEIVKPAESATLPEPTPVEPITAQPSTAAEPPKEIFQAKGDPKTGLLTNETVEAISRAIGGEEEIAMSWLGKQGWIQNGKIHTLSVQRAQRILNNPSTFINHINGGK